MHNLYVLLKIPPQSTHEEVEAAYLQFRGKVNSFAPGLNISQEEFEKQFPEINSAYNTLRDPLLRAEYDRSFSPAELVAPEPIVVEEVALTFRERLGLATTYAAFLGLMLMVILFLYMLAGYSL